MRSAYNPVVSIPLFPLHVVLFPGMYLPLHVFEPRYRAMMRDVLGDAAEPATDAWFGVVGIKKGSEVGSRAETHTLGCQGVVERVRRHPDGTMDLLVRGGRRFRILDRPDDDPYPRADPEFLAEPIGPRPEEALRLARDAIERYREVVSRLAHRPGDARPPLPDDPVAASYAAAAELRIETARQQQLLEEATASSRLARAAAVAREEASLLDAVGPPVGRQPLGPAAMN